MASTASHEGRSSALGDHIMVAGLGLQVLTLAIFMVGSPFLSAKFNIANTRQGNLLGLCNQNYQTPSRTQWCLS
jgi:hypothetical protein